MPLHRTAAGRQGSRCLVLAIAALGVGALIVCCSLAHATSSGESDEVARPQESMPQEVIGDNAAFAGIERSDCFAEGATCLATLPLGKSPSLPLACGSADQAAFQRLERQGELLDADPTLFAESYRTLIRARIACGAGNTTRALNLYDEIMESMHEKPVRGEAASRPGR